MNEVPKDVDDRVRELLLDSEIRLPIVVESVDFNRGRTLAPVDVLITGYSSEQRWGVLFNTAPRNQTILLEADDGAAYEGAIKRGQCFRVSYSRHDPTVAVREVLALLGEGLRTITLDISTLPVPLFFLLLRAMIDQRSATRVVIGYTEPEQYPDDDLTFGFSHIDPVPGYFGSCDPGKQTLLIALLGFEGRRTLAVYRYVVPDQTMAVNGFPAFRPGFEIRSFRSNLDFLTASGAINSLHSVPANQPAMLLQRLLRIYDRYRKDYNIYVSPLGSKPSGVAAALLGILREDVKIIYHYPTGASHEIPDGIGRTWLYHFSVEELCSLGDGI